ncbi:MAG: hypothetical protein RRY02_08250 [Muribaculaceae bacterium]
MKKTAMLLLLLCFLTSCPLLISRISIYIDNKSTDTILVYLGNKSAPYPDTLLHPNYKYGTRVLPKNKVDDSPKGDSFEDFFKRYFKSDTGCVSIVSVDTIRKYGWEDVRANHRVLVRYDLSYHDFMQLDRVIPYPPTPEMANMKMWPPYKKIVRK